MVNFTPRQILGKWRKGYALDLHTLSSIPMGYNEFGHMQFDTTRSEIGELLYRLKNKGDQSAISEIVASVVGFIGMWRPAVDMIVPVPPSTVRAIQPVTTLANAIGAKLNIPIIEAIAKTRETPQLKNIFDLDERLGILEGAHTANPALIKGRTVLLFDDLYRSGATMNSITTALYEQGEAADVYALTVTRTRSHQ
jgi:predicted amidophosphoribosyltransferase